MNSSLSVKLDCFDGKKIDCAFDNNSELTKHQQFVSESGISKIDHQFQCAPQGHGEIGRCDAMNLADNMHLLMHMHTRLHNRLLTAVVIQRGGISPQHLMSPDLSSSISSHSNSSEAVSTPRPEKSIHKCPQCGKYLVSKRNLKYHMKLHTGDMDYKCYICNKGFTHKNKLVIHIKLHTGQKDFVCSICSKAFVQKCDLLRHTKLHTGQKDFVCGICNKGFIQRSDLLKHSKLHTGQKDFVCSVCSKAFIQKSDLLRHSKTHWPDRCHV